MEKDTVNNGVVYDVDKEVSHSRCRYNGIFNNIWVRYGHFWHNPNVNF
jgi:hypothetical protein